MVFFCLVLAERNQKLYRSSILLSSTGFHLSRVCLNRRRWNLEEIKSRGQRSFTEEIVKKVKERQYRGKRYLRAEGKSVGDTRGVLGALVWLCVVTR